MASEAIKRGLPLGVLALLVFAGWRMTTLGLADHYAVGDPARALAWRADHPEALFQQAQRLADDSAQSAAAARFARRAMQVNPLDGRPYRVLGQVEADPEQAIALYRIAAARSPRDVASHALLIDHYLKQQDFPSLLAHVDTLLRVQPETSAQLVPLLAQMVNAPQAQPALADTLLTSPPWGDRLLSHIVQTVPETDAVGVLMDRLRKAPGRLSGTVLSAWLDRLTREDRWGQAYLTWVSQLPPERLNGLGNLYNGGFEWPPGEGGFDWRTARTPGARISMAPGAGVGGQAALRVAFADRRVPFSHVRQMMALPPGAYRLTGRARAESLRTERGLVWRVVCGMPPHAPLAETEPLRGQTGWREFGVDFEVPAMGCGGQWLTLTIPARIPAEQRVGGVAWFDDMRIARKSR